MNTTVKGWMVEWWFDGAWHPHREGEPTLYVFATRRELSDYWKIPLDRYRIRRVTATLKVEPR